MTNFKSNSLGFFAAVFILTITASAQVQQGHTNNSKFKQLYDQFADPNRYHNAS